MASSAFPAWHRWDRGFALGFVIVVWVAVLIGFYPSVSGRWHGQADYPAPPILEAHVFAFAAWLCLLTIQVLAIRFNRPQWHKRLGVLGALLIPVLVVTGIGAETYSQRFYSAQFPENLRFFVSPLLVMIVYTIAATAAVLLRKRPAAHKRLMLLATSMLLFAAYNRWWGQRLFELFGDGLWGMLIHTFTGMNMLLLALAGYDLLTRRRVHPVLLIGVPAIFAAEFAASLVYHSDWWPGVVRSLVGI